MSQSKLHSLYESVNSALFAAPTAILLHKAQLIIAGNNAINESQDIFVTVSWFMFFLHSIFWKFIIRRIYEKFGVKLDPIHLVAALKTKIYKSTKDKETL